MSRGGNDAEQTTPSVCPPEIFAYDATLDRFDGDGELLSQIVSLFLQDIARELDVLRATMEAEAWPEVHRVAHALRGAFANVGAARASAVAFSLEGIASSGRAHEAKRLRGLIEEEVGAYRREVAGRGVAGSGREGNSP